MAVDQKTLLVWIEALEAAEGRRAQTLTADDLQEIATALGYDEALLDEVARDAEEHAVRARTLRSAGRAGEAAAEISQAVALVPNRVDWLLELASLKLLLASEDEDRARPHWTECERLARRVLEIDPASAGAAHLLAKLDRSRHEVRSKRLQVTQEASRWRLSVTRTIVATAVCLGGVYWAGSWATTSFKAWWVATEPAPHPSLMRRNNTSSRAAPTPTIQMTATASDFIRGVHRGYSFHPGNVVDGRLGSSWQVSGGRDEWIEVRASRPRPLAALRIANGFQHRDTAHGDLFSSNRRLARAVLTTSSGLRREVEFDPDGRGYHTIPLDGAPTEWVRLTVLAFHRGTRWSDLAISEIDWQETQ